MLLFQATEYLAVVAVRNLCGVLGLGARSCQLQDFGRVSILWDSLFIGMSVTLHAAEYDRSAG
jgi:hypothetical protein